MEDTIERDPRHETWEAERISLVTRKQEVETLLDSLAEPDDGTYEDLISQGFSEDYCRDAADAALEKYEAKRLALRSEMRAILARLTLINPLVRSERAATNGGNITKEQKLEHHERLLGYLDRIATALELLAGCHKSNGRKRKTASVTN